MDHKTPISRIEIAAELGVQSQTIAHWEREGWFPRPKMQLLLKRIYYDRAEVKTELDARRRSAASAHADKKMKEAYAGNKKARDAAWVRWKGVNSRGCRFGEKSRTRQDRKSVV